MEKMLLWGFVALGGAGLVWKLLIGHEAWAIHWAFGIARSHPAFWACIKKYAPEIKKALDVMHDEADKELDA